MHGRVNAHALQHVRKRQKRDAEVAFFVGVHFRGVDRRVIKIGMGDHGALGRPRRSGRVGDRRQIAGLHGPPDRFEPRRVGGVRDPARFQKALQCHHARGQGSGGRIKEHHFFGPAGLGPDRKQFHQERFVFYKADRKAAVRNHVRDLPETRGRIEADGHAARRKNGNINFAPFPARAAGNADRISFFHSQRHKSHDGKGQEFPGLAPGHGLPDTVFLRHGQGPVAEAAGLLHEDSANGRRIVQGLFGVDGTLFFHIYQPHSPTIPFNPALRQLRKRIPGRCKCRWTSGCFSDSQKITSISDAAREKKL